MDDSRKKTSKRGGASSEQIDHLEERIRDLEIKQSYMKEGELKSHECRLRKVESDVVELQMRQDRKKADSQLRTKQNSLEIQLQKVQEEVAGLKSDRKSLDGLATTNRDAVGVGNVTLKANQPEGRRSLQQKYDNLLKHHDILVVNHNAVHQRLINLERQFERLGDVGKSRSRQEFKMRMEKGIWRQAGSELYRSQTHGIRWFLEEGQDLAAMRRHRRDQYHCWQDWRTIYGAKRWWQLCSASPPIT